MNTTDAIDYLCGIDDIDDANDAIRAQVEAELPRPAGGFESSDQEDAHRSRCDARFFELCAAIAKATGN